MAGPDSKLSFTVSGGVNEQATDELFGAIVQQGSAPALKTSDNTRLSVIKGTCARAPEYDPTDLSLGTNKDVYGLVGDGVHDRVAVYTRPDLGSQVVADDGLTDCGVIRDIGPGGWQNGYLPLQMTAAGALPTTRLASGIAVCHNTALDEIWYAWISVSQEDLSLARLYVCCYAQDGTLKAPPMAAPINIGFGGPQPASLQPKVGLTAHGTNGVALWYGLEDPPGYAIIVKKLSVVGGAATFSPSGSSSNLVVGEQLLDWDVCTYDDFQAIVVASSDSNTDDGRVYLVSVNTATWVDTFTRTGATNGVQVWAACHVETIAGQKRVAVVWANVDTATLTYALLDSSLNEVWPTVAISTADSPENGRVAVKFLVSPTLGVSSFVIAVEASDITVTWGDQTPVSPTLPHYVALWQIRLSDGTRFVQAPLLYSNLQNKGAQWVTGSEMYPVFCVGRAYARGGLEETLPGGIAWTDDPSIDAYLLAPSSLTSAPFALVATPIARFGVVRGNLAPASITPNIWFVAGPAACANGVMTFAYAKGLIGSAVSSYGGRFVQLKMTPEQPSVAVDRDGIAFIAAALPATWDGVETVETGGPLHAPKLQVGLDSATGALPDAGVYQFRAIYVWTDAAGMTHRSRPSNQVTVTADGVTDKFWAVVSMPDSMRNGVTQSPIDVQLYLSGANEVSMHLVGNEPVYINGMAVWETLQTSTTPNLPVSLSNPQLYSGGGAGEELTPQPPPPLRDIAVVGSRLWGVDAEIPSRLVYSKLRIAGVGFEFFPAGEVLLPSGAGDVVAIREMAGTLVAFAERGVYQVADGGPNNAGQGGGFGQPYRISDVGCQSRKSVLSTPAGIVFLANTGRFCMVQGGTVIQMPGVELNVQSESVTGAWLFDEADEAVFVVGDRAKVYNYGVQKWTNWDLPITPDLAVGSNVNRSAAMLYSASEGILRRTDTRSRNSTADMLWETDWILLGGDFEDHVLLRSVLFSGKRVTPHGVEIRIFTNYGTTPSTTSTWTDTEISSLVNDANRFTLKVEPARQDTRAVKIQIAEVASAADDRVGLLPLGVTIVYALESMLHEEAYGVGAFKGPDEEMP